MNNVKQGPWATVAGGSEPPHDGSMETRVAKLETLIPTLATKADMGELRADFEKGQKENRAWMLATVIALFLGVLAAGNFIASGLRPVTAPAKQETTAQPIIIQIPAQQTASPAKGDVP